jgi:hypothetical protein
MLDTIGLVAGLAKIFLLGVTVQTGIVPGHSVALNNLQGQEGLDTSYSIFFESNAELCIGKHLCLYGGMRAYCLRSNGTLNGYPFRMNFPLGLCLMVGGVEIGYHHECDHPMGPNTDRIPEPIDFHFDRIYGKYSFLRSFNNFNVKTSLEEGYIPATTLSAYTAKERELISEAQVVYADLQTRVDVAKLFFFEVGAKAYFPNKKSIFDYNVGTGVRIGKFEAGWKYGLDYPMSQDGTELPLPELDKKFHTFYISAELGKTWRK